MQSFRLPQFEDLAVVESVNFVLEELQGGRLTRQSPGDLLPHHLHHLRTDMGAQTGYMLLVFHGMSACLFNTFVHNG